MVFQMFNITNWNFEGNSWGTSGTDLWLKSGESHITNSNFRLNIGPSSINLEGGDFYAKNINMINQNQEDFERNYVLFGSGIIGTSMNYFYLFNSSFSNINYGIYGGAVSLLILASAKNKIPQKPNYNIINKIDYWIEFMRPINN